MTKIRLVSVLSGLIQILIALFLLFRYPLLFVQKSSVLIHLAVVFFSLHLILSGVSILKHEKYGRNSTIGNMFSIAVLLVIVLIAVEFKYSTIMLLSIVLIIVSLYLMRQLIFLKDGWRNS